MILDIIKPIQLISGSHETISQDGKGCFMNVAAYLNGDEHISDVSPCVSPIVRDFAVFLNDYMSDDERQQLLPYVHRAMQTGMMADQENLAEIRRQALAASRFLSKLMIQLLDERDVQFANRGHTFEKAIEGLEDDTQAPHQYIGYSISALRCMQEFIFTNREDLSSFLMDKEMLKVKVFAFFQSLLPEEKDVPALVASRAQKLVDIATQ